jgi:hypothetical protein
MDRRRREHSRVLGTRQRGILQARVDELHIAKAVELIASPRDQLLARLHGRHPQPAGQQAARELTRAAPDLKHRGAGALAHPVDENLRVGRTMTLIVLGDVIEDPSIAAGVGVGRAIPWPPPAIVPALAAQAVLGA